MKNLLLLLLIAGLLPANESFERRNAPEEVAAAARNLFVHLDLERGELAAVRAADKAGDSARALDAYRSYLFRKLRFSEAYGLSRENASPYGKSITERTLPALREAADDLMKKNVLRARQGGVRLAAPGSVDWAALGEDGWYIERFDPLLASYVATGDKGYLDRWAALADDWALNLKTGPTSLAPERLPDRVHNGPHQILVFLQYLGGIAAMPGGEEAFPAATLARVLVRLYQETLPATVIYARSNPQNWDLGLSPELLAVGLFLDEFRAAPYLVREARRTFETYIALNCLPDGTEHQRDPWYNRMLVEFGNKYLAVLRLKPQVWFGIPQERELRDAMRSRVRFLIHHLTADGEYPIGARTDRRNHLSTYLRELQTVFPEGFEEPDNLRLFSTAGKGNDSPPPSFLSEMFPWGGYTYLRSGWRKGDPYLYFFTSAYAAKNFRSANDNNFVGLSAWGQDLLVSEAVGAYERNNTPVLVDGREQFFHAGIPSWGHRGPMNVAQFDLMPRRFHTSAHFDLTEGFYRGAWGDHRSTDRSPAEQGAGARQAVRGPVHHRQVHFVRDAGLFLLTDRMHASGSHRYTQTLPFPIQPGKYPAFAETEVGIEEASQRIETRSAVQPNLSVHHVGPAVQYSKEVRKSKGGYALWNVLRVDAGWEGSGDQALITLLYPRRPGAPDLQRVRALNRPGETRYYAVEALTPGGERVQFAAARREVVPLELDGVRAVAESVLVVTSPGGVTRGVALGCRGLSIGGRRIAPAHPDFEFSADGETIPIYPPLDLVRIGPELPIFQDRVAVKLSAPAGAEIRYTLDGTDPTLQSPLYTGPVMLDRSATVKARCFRPGVKIMPSTMNGTDVSPVSSAEFARATPSPAKRAAGRPGLLAESFAGAWPDLYLFPYKLRAVKSEVADALFRGTTGGQAVRYTGCLDVPKTGVYTFYAPREFVVPDVMAGYELRLSLGGREWFPRANRQGFGSWSVALAQGCHPLEIYYADVRSGAAKELNQPGMRPFVWEGAAPVIDISGPGLERRPIPVSMFRH